MIYIYIYRLKFEINIGKKSYEESKFKIKMNFKVLQRLNDHSPPPPKKNIIPIIPTRDPKQRGGSKRIMNYNVDDDVNVDDNVDRDGDVDDDGDDDGDDDEEEEENDDVDVEEEEEEEQEEEEGGRC